MTVSPLHALCMRSRHPVCSDWPDRSASTGRRLTAAGAECVARAGSERGEQDGAVAEQALPLDLLPRDQTRWQRPPPTPPRAPQSTVPSPDHSIPGGIADNQVRKCVLAESESVAHPRGAATEVSASGSATYDGRTLAANQEGNLYSGSIALEVRFTRMSVDDFVTALARADNQEPSSHGLGGGFGTATAAGLLPKTLANAAWISSERRWRCRARCPGAAN